MYDAIVVGGGPAGLSAALVLGRCRRRVLVLDAGQPRNFATRQIHGFLSRDGISPQELLRKGRVELARYSVEIRELAAENAVRGEHGFTVTLAGGEQLLCRALLLATGVLDRIPEVPGMGEFYGRGVFHCAYCDGWEVRDQPVAVYGRGKPGALLATTLQTWTSDVILCTDGGPYLRPPEADLLERSRIPVRSERIARLEGSNGELERIVFRNGAVSARRALFLATGQTQRSPLAVQLGCELNEKGAVRTTLTQGTGVEGLFVAGDACHDVQFTIVAAAEGAKAAVAINRMLQGDGE